MENCTDASRLVWAHSLFGLEPGAAPQEVRAAIVAHLDDANLVPPVAFRQAIWLLSDSCSPQAWPTDGYDAFHEAMENRLAEEVDQFAAEFFTLPSGPRRQKWTQLIEQATAFPRLSARLTLLQPGLDADSAAADGQDPQEAVLVERIRRLFVLKPGAHDAQRREWLAATTGDWRGAVRRVRDKYPGLARLENDFLSALAAFQYGAVAAKRTAALAARTNLAAGLAPRPATVNAPSPVRRPFSPAGNSSSSSGGRRYWWVIGVAVFLVLRVMASLSSNSTTNSYHPPPVYTPPTYTPPPTYNPPPYNPYPRYNPPPSDNPPSVHPGLSDETVKAIQDALNGQKRRQGGTPAPWTPDEPNPRNPALPGTDGEGESPRDSDQPSTSPRRPFTPAPTDSDPFAPSPSASEDPQGASP